MKKINLIFTIFLLINPILPSNALTITSQQLAPGETLVSIDQRKILFSDFYKRYIIHKALYIKQLKFDILASEADNTAAMKQRQALRNQLTKEEINKIVQGSENLWQKFKQENASSNELFQKKLQYNNLTETAVKTKFVDNLLMIYYFDKYIAPKLVETLVNEDLAIEAASFAAIKTSDEELQKQILNLAEDLGGEIALNQFLKKNNISKEEFSANVKKDLLISKFKNSLSVNDKNNLEKLKELYYENRLESEFTTPERIYFSQLYLPKDKTAKHSIEEKRLVIKDAQQRFAKNTKPMILTSEYTELGLIYQPMTLPYESGSNLYAKEITDALKSLKIGESSPVIETSRAFHVLRVDKISAKEIIPYEKVQALIEARIIDSRNEQLFLTWLKEQRAKTKIEYNQATLATLFGDSSDTQVAELGQDQQTESTQQLAPVEEKPRITKTLAPENKQQRNTHLQQKINQLKNVQKEISDLQDLFKNLDSQQL